MQSTQQTQLKTKNPNRRIRRNFDVLFNAQKGSRSVSKTTAISSQQPQVPKSIYNQFTGAYGTSQKMTGTGSREPKLSSGGPHSHSQQILDNHSQIQQKINIYNQQKKQTFEQGNSPVPIGRQGNKFAQIQEYPSQANSANQSGANQFYPMGQPQNNSSGTRNQNLTAGGYYDNSNSTGQLGQLLPSNNSVGALIQNSGHRSQTQQKNYQSTRNLSSNAHSKAQKNGGSKSNNASGILNSNTLYSQISLKDINSPMKYVSSNTTKGNRQGSKPNQGNLVKTQLTGAQNLTSHMQQIQQYGGSALPKQYNNKYLNNTGGILPQGPLNQTSQSVIDGAHEAQFVSNFLPQTGDMITNSALSNRGKQIVGAQGNGLPNHNNTQPLLNLNGEQNVIAASKADVTGTVYPNQKPNGRQANTSGNRAGQAVEFRGYNVVALGPQLQNNDTMNTEGQKSRNGQIINQTTNGAMNGSGPGNGAILNINTASDINIYNNSFIVKTSQNKTQQGKLSSRSSSIKRGQRINTNVGGATTTNGRISKITSQKTSQQDRNGNNSVINNVALNHQTQALRQDMNYPRSFSQGRGPKLSSNSRGQANQDPERANMFAKNASGQQLPNQIKGNSTTKVQAIAEAYNQNTSYMINNQQMQMHGGQINNSSLQSQQQINSWRSNNSQNQPPGSNSKNFSQNKRQMKQSRTSTENLKYRTNENNATDTQVISQDSDHKVGGSIRKKMGQSGGYLPQYNNLLVDQQLQVQREFNHGMMRKTTGTANGRRMAKNGGSTSVSRGRDSNSNTSIPSITNQQITSNTTSQLNFIESENNLRKQKAEQAKGLIIMGRKKIQTKEYAEAIKIFTQVIDKVDPDNVKAIFYRALSYLDQGNLQQAISELWQVVSKYNESKERHEASRVASQISIVPIQKSANQSGKGTSIQKEGQLCQQAYILLSIAHKKLGESQNAIDDLDKCLELFPKYPDALLARGQALLHQENTEKAFQDLQLFNQLQKDSFAGQLAMGDCLKALKRYMEAIESYSAAILLLDSQKAKQDFDKLRLQCFMKRALASFHGQQYQQSLADLHTVIKEDNQDVKAHFYIGRLLAKGVENRELKQTDAILHFEQVAKYPEQEFYAGNALFQIAKLRLRQKDFYEAYYCLKRASDNNFSSKRMAMYKDFTEGVLYLIKRKIKKGVQILTDLLEILVNKEKERAKQQEKDKLNKKLTDPTGEDNIKETEDQKIAREKQQLSEKAHSDYLIQQIYMFRAYGYVAIEKYEMAQEDIKRVKKMGKVDAASIYNKYLGKGILRMDHEDYLMASKYFAKAWKKFPTNKDPYCLQVISIVRSYSFSLSGYSIDQQIKFDKVLETKRFLDKSIRNCNKKVKEPSLYFFRGLLNFHLHRFYDALQDFNQAINEEEESTAFFYLARGRCYACLSILTEAMKDLSVALNLDETLQQGYIYRGKCAYLLGDNNLAFLDFQRLILTDPKNPMVHIYAGNLLMTTGAYSDAIKAFENADTVEPTAISAFQRVRCFCAIADLEKARQMMNIAREAQPDDVILQFDSMCLDQLYMVSQVTRQLNSSQNRTAADIKHADKVMNNSTQMLNMLIKTYESDKLTHLKRKDANLNIQLIPNIERIKIEKAAVSRDFYEARLEASPEEQQELPMLEYDVNMPIDFAPLSKMKNVSYYFENIFAVEDFYLYRGVINFYQRQYKTAIEDFKLAQKSHVNNLKPLAGDDGDGNGAVRDDVSNFSRMTGANTQNHSLRMYTDQSAQASMHSNKTDLSDVGLCSFNSNETTYNMLLCYLFLDDKANAFQMLNDLFKNLPRKYAGQLPIIRALVLDHFGGSDKAQAELKRFRTHDQKTHDMLFGPQTGQKDDDGKINFFCELFPSTGRLCSQFEPLVLPIATKGLGAKITLKVCLSFSMPFIKPPNMIPNVDEDSIHSEFNLKQIDAPMPEAPWLKRCEHGVQFTNNLQMESMTEIEKQKYKKHFDTSASKKEDKKSSRRKDQAGTKDAFNVASTSAAGARLLENFVAETISDKHKISLMEDSRVYEEECHIKECETAQIDEQARTGAGRSRKRSRASINDLRSMVQSQMSGDYADSYDSECEMEESEDDLDLSKIISGHDELLLLDRDSMVNLGGNVAHELKKQKKTRQHVQKMIDTGNNPANLLPSAEQQKALLEKTSNRVGTRYNDDEQSAKPDDERLESEDFGESRRQVRQQMVLSKKEPHGLNEQMLVGQQAKKRKRERHVSNLSIGQLPSPGDQPPTSDKKGAE